MEIASSLHPLVMRSFLLNAALALSTMTHAQGSKVNELPEFVYIPPATDRYVWQRIVQEKGRTLFNNEVADRGDVTYSFGGFNTLRVQREMNRIEDGRLVRDTISYPGQGFMNNLFFIRDSFMYIGGGLDSGASLYAYNDFWQYNLQRHSWTRSNDLPFYYHHPLSVFHEPGRVIVLAASLQKPDLKIAAPALFAYDPALDNWSSIAPELPPSRFSDNAAFRGSTGLSQAAFRIGDDIFVLFQVWETGTHTFYKFNLKSQEWSELPPFPGKTPKLFGAFSFSDETYGYVGGGSGKMAANSKEVFRFDPEKEKWERITDLPLGVRYAKGWRYKGESYVGFGINDKEQTVVVWRLRQRK